MELLVALGLAGIVLLAWRLLWIGASRIFKYGVVSTEGGWVLACTGVLALCTVGFCTISVGTFVPSRYAMENSYIQAVAVTDTMLRKPSNAILVRVTDYPEISSILREGSKVIIDEWGKGTESYEYAFCANSPAITEKLCLLDRSKEAAPALTSLDDVVRATTYPVNNVLVAKMLLDRTKILDDKYAVIIPDSLVFTSLNAGSDETSYSQETILRYLIVR